MYYPTGGYLPRRLRGTGDASEASASTAATTWVTGGLLLGLPLGLTVLEHKGPFAKR